RARSATGPRPRPGGRASFPSKTSATPGAPRGSSTRPSTSRASPPPGRFRRSCRRWATRSGPSWHRLRAFSSRRSSNRARAARPGSGPRGAPAMRASEALPVRFNAAAHFIDRNAAEGRGASPAFLCEGQTLSYSDLQALANRTGNALRGLGVKAADRVVMICLDGPEFLGTFWGAIKIGAVPVPVNTLLRAADYRHVLHDSQARVAVVSAPLLAEAAPALRESSSTHVLVAGPHEPFLSWAAHV